MTHKGAYYNEIDPYCVEWLRNLIREDMIADGEVDDRDIREVEPGDLQGFAQCHFFAGIAGWSLALRLAGWPDDRPVWTGSCPCQPFSAAGKRKGFDDDRHLWPDWFRLIRERRPPVVFGEQVARAVGQGWLDTVADDLEGEGYAVGAAVLPACAVAAPHVRERLWFVAHAADGGRWHTEAASVEEGSAESSARSTRQLSGRPEGHSAALAHADFDARQQRRSSHTAESARGRDADRGGERADALAHAAHEHEHGSGQAGATGRHESANAGGDVADAAGPQLRQEPPAGHECGHEAHFGANGYVWPPEPDLPRVAHGIPARVAKLRALGNAVVPPLAAEFIRAADEAMSPSPTSDCVPQDSGA